MNAGGDTEILLRSLSDVNVLIIAVIVLGTWVAIALSSRFLIYLITNVSNSWSICINKGDTLR